MDNFFFLIDNNLDEIFCDNLIKIYLKNIFKKIESYFCSLFNNY
jgi:hypothetical protein